MKKSIGLVLATLAAASAQAAPFECTVDVLAVLPGAAVNGINDVAYVVSPAGADVQ